MPAEPFFTVFTPTYNRAHTLHRVFESLCAQTFRDFEWVVVDDGSTDNTSELIHSWTEVADFPIRYFRQPNSGKHMAHNIAVREARGWFFAPVDSDDAMSPDALERVHAIWHELPDTERSIFCGVGGLCRDQFGAVIGDRFPTSPYDADFREMSFFRRVGGDKWCAQRTDVLRRYPFPAIPGTNFVPEGLLWLQIARAYKFRFVNEVFGFCYVASGETGENLSSRRNVRRSARGRLYYNVWLLNNELEYFWRSPVPFIKAAAMLPVVSRYAGLPLRDVWRELKGCRARLLTIALSPLSMLLVIFHAVRVPTE
jgi:glycosyltransferase involved in cell wall biosynthesis